MNKLFCNERIFYNTVKMRVACARLQKEQVIYTNMNVTDLCFRDHDSLKYVSLDVFSFVCMEDFQIQYINCKLVM